MDIPKHYAAFFIAAALAATFVPVLFVLHTVGGLSHWEGVLPKGTTDSTYYYARVHEVLDGHPLIGNPFAYEHRGALPPAQFIPDVVAAVPGLLGIPFDIAMVLNVFVWALAFFILAFVFLRMVGVGRRWAALWTIVAYVCAYSFMLRPVVMQAVYPALLLFMIALWRFVEEPHSRRRILMLAAATAATFYLYTFLFYVAVLSLAATFVWYTAARRWTDLRALIYVGLLAVVCIVPGGLLTLWQMHDPNYLATFVRIGLVYTHLPSAESFFYGRWIAAVVALGALLWYGFARRSADKHYLIWVVTGVGFVAALFLNAVTGVELTLGVHVGRLAIPWLPLAAGALSWYWWSVRTHRSERHSTLVAFACAGALLLIIVVGVLASVPRGLDFFKFDKRPPLTSDEQTYAAPLRWLEKNIPEESVVLAHDSLSTYIPIMTRHYPLFTLTAGLHNLSDQELLERYLLSRSLGQLTSADLKRDFDLYTGAGAGLQVVAQQEAYYACRLAARLTGPRNCTPPQDAMSARGEEYFEGLLRQFADVKKARAGLMAQYHVSYLLIDRKSDQWESLPLKRAVYDDGRFAIVPASAL